jgi:hypothetical protein
VPFLRPRRSRRLRRFVRRAVVLGSVAGAVGAYRNRRIEENRRRYDLP